MFCLIQKWGKERESALISLLHCLMLVWFCQVTSRSFCVCVCVCVFKGDCTSIFKEELRASATAFKTCINIPQVPISIWLHCHVDVDFFSFLITSGDQYCGGLLWKTFRLFQTPTGQRPWLPCRSRLCVVHRSLRIRWGLWKTWRKYACVNCPVTEEDK